jgi:ABC-type amino acid transport substrate-binding protein
VHVFFSNSSDQGFFKFLDTSGSTKGLDVKLMHGIVAQLPKQMHIAGEFTLVPRYVAWQELLTSLDQDQADIIISTISKTAKREQDHRIRFTDPYYRTGLSLVYRWGESVGPLTDTLKGKRVGVQGISTSEELISELRKNMTNSPEIVPFPQAEEMIDALLKHQTSIVYGIADTPFARSAQLKTWQGASNRIGYKILDAADYPWSP